MKILRLLLLLLLSGYASAQSEIQVVSIENNEPVPFARVEIISPAGKTSAVTDDRGIFKLVLDKNYSIEDYSLTIKAYGFETFEDKLQKDHPRKCPLRPLIKSIDEVVVTGQIALTTTENAVQKIKVIDRKTIDSKGAVNLRDVLQNELNIRLSQDQVLGSGMTLQGVSGENVKILLDGVPVIGRMNGDIDLSQINLANIERIEIVEGPLSVAYGSNALAGTINLISKKTLKNGQEIQVNSYYETVGNYNLDGRATVNHKKHKISVFGGRNYFDGWSKTDPWIDFPKEKIADSGRFQTWKPKEQFNAGINYTFQVKRTSISPFADAFWETIHNKGLPRAPFFITSFDDYYHTKRTNQGVHFQSLLKDKYKIQGVVAHNYYQRIKNTYLKDLTNLNEQLTQASSDQDTSVFRTFMSRSTFSKSRSEAKINYEVGYDVNYEIAIGKRIDKGRKEMGDYAIFGSLDWNVNKNLILKPALRTAVNSVYGPSAIPSLNVKWSHKKSTWRGSYASGYRAPSMKELYMDFVDINHNITGNRTLTPEKSHHFQAWYNAKKRFTKTELDFEVSGFYQHVRDKISLSQDAVGANYSYFNLDKFESTGARGQIGWNSEVIQLKTGFAYMGTKTNYGNGKFIFSPEINASLTFNWKKPQITFFAYYKYTGKLVSYLQADDATLQQFSINDYNMIDFNMSREFLKKRISVSLGAKNLLNVTSVNSSGSTGAHSGGGGSTPIGWGRSYYIKLQIKLSTFNK